MTQEKQSGNTPATGSPTTLTELRQKKGASRFLSLLCCGLPKGGTLAEDDEEGIAAKKTTKTRPDRTALPAAQKPDASTAESSAAESKEPVSEKVGDSSRTHDAGVVNEKREMPSGVQGDAAGDKLASQAGVFRKTSRGRQAYDQTLQPTTSQPTRLETDLPSSHDQWQSGGPSIAVQAPTPVVAPDEELIHDRTPQQEQRDSDIEMTDAGPSVPLSANDVSGTSEDSGAQPAHHGVTTVKIDLPPPPPLSERQAQVTPPHSPAAAGEPGQKWLLPPIKPELKGRKCLVLDLDETLVHSSFKVRSHLQLTSSISPNDNQILHQADFTIPVQIEDQYHNVYVIKRPGVDDFMRRVGELYEVVVFTASVSKVGYILSSQRDLWLRSSSTVTRFLTSWISTVPCTTGYSVRAATITRATMSRQV